MKKTFKEAQEYFCNFIKSSFRGWFEALILCSSFSGLVAVSAQGADNRAKLEEMYIWKISEELKLTSQEDREFAKVVKQINSARAQANDSLKAHLNSANEELRKNQSGFSAQKSDKWLKEYKRLLTQYGKLSTDEIDKIRKVLGQDRAVRYFALKSEMVERFKNLLTPQAQGGEKADGDPPSVIKTQPKIIEEK